MKNLLAILVVACALLGGRGVLAQDAIGLYFDDQGSVSEVTTAVPNEIVQAWLILENPSQSGGIAGWECEVGTYTNGATPFVIWEVQGAAINFASPPRFSVGLGTPLPQLPVVALAMATVIVPDPTREISFLILPYDPPSLLDPPGSGYPVQKPLYISGLDGDLYALSTSSGCPGSPVAHINSDGGDAVPQLTGFPRNLYFDSATVGATTTANFRIVNPDSLPVIGEIRLEMAGCTYNHSGGFYTDLPTTFRMAANGDLFIYLAFVLPAEGLLDGHLIVDVCGQEYVVDLHGGGRMNCVVSTAQLDFGDVPVGAELTGDLTLYNRGDYTFNAMPEFQELCAPFSWALLDSQVDPTALLPSESLTVQVTYRPVVEAHDYCTLAFGDGECSEVAIDGRAFDWAPVCSIEPASLDFGGVVQDSTSRRSFLITNTGGGHLTGTVNLVDPSGGFTLLSGGGPFDLTYDQDHQVDVVFLPTVNDAYTAELDLGTGCAPVPLLGQGIDGVPVYRVNPVEFGVMEIGDTRTRYFYIYNEGLVSISGDLQISGDPSFSLATPGPFVIAPGRGWNSAVEWQVTGYGEAVAQISTGLPNGDIAPCTGFGVSLMPGPENLIGLYFDADYGSSYTHAEPGFSVPGYLVVQMPSAPIGGWEMALLFAGDAQPISWVFHGVASGELGPNQFRVLLDSPLPTAATVLLATADILVPSSGATSILATGLADAMIPGYGSYLDGNLPGNILPLGRTNGMTLATINPVPVGVDAPAAPTAETVGGEVVLVWSCASEMADGYHVYREFDQGPPLRLTATPVGCDQGWGSFRDQPQAASGTVAVYRLTRVVNGLESSPSVAAEITLQSGIPIRTRLLANFPNPFNPQTTVPFEMARPGHVRLAVYDAAGKLVRVLVDAEFPAGRDERIWLGRDAAGNRVPSGVYYLRLETENRVETGKALLLK